MLMSRATILIIEDNEGDYDLVRELLPEDIETVWSPTARLAHKCLHERTFDLILLDNGLPDSNGLAVLGRITKEYPDCPVVMLTGREDPTLALSAVSMGAKSYLVKNEVMSHLLPLLDEILQLELESNPADKPVRFIDTAERFYPVLLDNISEGCLVVDEDGIITFSNRAGQAFTGDREHSLLGLSMGELFTPSTRPAWDKELERARWARSAQTLSFEATIQHPVAHLPVRVSMRNVYTETGRFQNATLVLTDRTKEINAQEQRRDLVRSLVHDLRTPLNGIQGALSLLETIDLQTESDEAREFIDIIGLSAAQLLKLVDDILELERLEAGTISLSPQRTRLADTIYASIRAQSAVATAKKVQIVQDLRSPDAVVWVDSLLLSRVLQNLLANAIRHSPIGASIVIELTACVTRGTRKHFEISITDSGPGVSDAIEARIFEKFVHCPNGGSGLGLTFCKLAIEAHGGEIWFTNLPTRGARFSFRVPERPVFPVL